MDFEQDAELDFEDRTIWVRPVKPLPLCNAQVADNFHGRRGGLQKDVLLLEGLRACLFAYWEVYLLKSQTGLAHAAVMSEYRLD